MNKEILNTSIDPFIFGKILHKQGFRTWFLYMFNTINKNKFIIDNIHNDIFDCFQNIYNFKSFRDIINIPPRAGKTTMACYFIAYCLVVNKKCNFIYTSYSQDLLSTISKQVRDILENPIYKILYETNNSYEEIEEKPINSFWEEYLLKSKEGKNSYSSSKITTSEGGIILFASIGSAITGFGAGIKGIIDKFTGALIIDDANKPNDIMSVVMREKIQEYYTLTLLSRLNNSKTSIINIQQRLDIEDITGFLINTYGIKEIENKNPKDIYKFNLLKKPLIENDEIQLKNQYDELRIEELKRNIYVFESQYQQNPRQNQGAFFKKELIESIQITMQEIQDKKGYYIISVDTASGLEKANDYSAIAILKLCNNDGYRLYLENLFNIKMEPLELSNFVGNIANSFNGNCCILMEENHVGVAIRNLLEVNYNADVRKIKRNISLRKNSGDSRARNLKEDMALNLLFKINQRKIFFPIDNDNNFMYNLKKQLYEFPSGKHDDMIDSLSNAIYYMMENLNY